MNNCLESVQQSRLFKPGDLIRRYAYSDAGKTLTTLYVDPRKHPASSGIDHEAGDKQHVLNKQCNVPALVVATYTHFIDSCKNKHALYAYVVWPGTGLGWVWIGDFDDDGTSDMLRDRWNHVVLT